MREVTFAPSFDDELLQISLHIENSFGVNAAEEFESRVRDFSRALATTPLIGTRDHGYPTTLYGFVLHPNWIFYRFDEEQITLLHIRSTRMSKATQAFAEKG